MRSLCQADTILTSNDYELEGNTIKESRYASVITSGLDEGIDNFTGKSL